MIEGSMGEEKIDLTKAKIVRPSEIVLEKSEKGAFKGTVDGLTLETPDGQRWILPGPIRILGPVRTVKMELGATI